MPFAERKTNTTNKPIIMQIHLIAAARPNFMKIAPLYHALCKAPWAEPVIVHTGQHYDLNMSDAFFTDLNLPSPHIHLGVGSGSHAEQTGKVMIAYEKVIFEKNRIWLSSSVMSTRRLPVPSQPSR